MRAFESDQAKTIIRSPVDGVVMARLYGERLQVEMLAGPMPGRFDAEALRRALINLIDNGLGACARAGRPERPAGVELFLDEHARAAAGDPSASSRSAAQPEGTPAA